MAKNAELVTLKDLREMVRGNELPEVEDPEQIKLAIIDQILASDTLEAVFDNTSTVAMGECVGRRIELRDARILKSEIEGALPVYMLADCVDLDTGERIVMNTGSGRVMAQAWKAKELNALPHKVQIVEVGRAKPGQNAPIGLASLGAAS